jgi:DNA-binding transcriptional regulator YhcF (GntR family)
MKQVSSIWKLIDIDIYSATPKYLQLANSIIKAIREKKVIASEVLPSIKTQF